MKIRVKRKHVMQGRCGSPYACALALAVQEALGIDEEKAIVVHERFVSVHGHSYELSRRASQFIDKFDDCGKNVTRRKALPLLTIQVPGLEDWA